MKAETSQNSIHCNRDHRISSYVYVLVHIYVVLFVLAAVAVQPGKRTYIYTTIHIMLICLILVQFAANSINVDLKNVDEFVFVSSDIDYPADTSWVCYNIIYNVTLISQH
jgi:hypothetical protein